VRMLKAAKAYAAGPALLGYIDERRAKEYAVTPAIHAARIKEMKENSRARRLTSPIST